MKPESLQTGLTIIVFYALYNHCFLTYQSSYYILKSIVVRIIHCKGNQFI